MNIMLRSGFSIGSIEIKFYAICILIGAFLGALVAVKEGKRLGLLGDEVLDGIIVGIVVGIIGARIYYVIFEWNSFENFGDMINIRSGGLAIHGGIIFGIIFAYLYCRFKKINLFKMLDILAPGFLIGQICGRWGNFFNQEAHGGPTTRAFLRGDLHLPKFIVDNMCIDGVYYHPTFLYESLWNVVGLTIILILRRRKKIVKLGDIMPFYLVWYSIGRFFIEGMRTDSLYIGSIKQNQLISIILIVAGIAILVLKRTVWKTKFNDYVSYLDKGLDPKPVKEVEPEVVVEEDPNEDKYWMVDHNLDEEKTDEVALPDDVKTENENASDDDIDDRFWLYTPKPKDTEASPDEEKLDEEALPDDVKTESENSKKDDKND